MGLSKAFVFVLFYLCINTYCQEVKRISEERLVQDYQRFFEFYYGYSLTYNSASQNFHVEIKTPLCRDIDDLTGVYNYRDLISTFFFTNELPLKPLKFFVVRRGDRNIENISAPGKKSLMDTMEGAKYDVDTQTYYAKKWLTFVMKYGLPVGNDSDYDRKLACFIASQAKMSCAKEEDYGWVIKKNDKIKYYNIYTMLNIRGARRIKQRFIKFKKYRFDLYTGYYYVPDKANCNVLAFPNTLTSAEFLQASLGKHLFLLSDYNILKIGVDRNYNIMKDVFGDENKELTSDITMNPYQWARAIRYLYRKKKLRKLLKKTDLKSANPLLQNIDNDSDSTVVKSTGLPDGDSNGDITTQVGDEYVVEESKNELDRAQQDDSVTVKPVSITTPLASTTTQSPTITTTGSGTTIMTESESSTVNSALSLKNTSAGTEDYVSHHHLDDESVFYTDEELQGRYGYEAYKDIKAKNPSTTPYVKVPGEQSTINERAWNNLIVNDELSSKLFVKNYKNFFANYYGVTLSYISEIEMFHVENVGMCGRKFSVQSGNYNYSQLLSTFIFTEELSYAPPRYTVIQNNNGSIQDIQLPEGVSYEDIGFTEDEGDTWHARDWVGVVLAYGLPVGRYTPYDQKLACMIVYQQGYICKYDGESKSVKVIDKDGNELYKDIYTMFEDDEFGLKNAEHRYAKFSKYQFDMFTELYYVPDALNCNILVFPNTMDSAKFLDSDRGRHIFSLNNNDLVNFGEDFELKVLNEIFSIPPEYIYANLKFTLNQRFDAVKFLYLETYEYDMSEISNSELRDLLFENAKSLNDMSDIFDLELREESLFEYSNSDDVTEPKATTTQSTTTPLATTTTTTPSTTTSLATTTTTTESTTAAEGPEALLDNEVLRRVYDDDTGSYKVYSHNIPAVSGDRNRHSYGVDAICADPNGC